MSLPQRAPSTPRQRDATVDPSWSADAILGEVQRLYRELQALPYDERPDARSPRRSAAYTALETRIRVLAARYWTLSRE